MKAPAISPDPLPSDGPAPDRFGKPWPPASEGRDHRATITQRLAAQIGGQILTGAYAAGTPLREGELAARYEVSRHVIREVLRTLAADGLIHYTSFKGARIPLFTQADARDIYRARRMAECGPEAMSPLPEPGLIGRIHRDFARAVARKAWAQAFDLDVAFHSEIVAAAGSARTASWHRSVLQDLRLAQLVAPGFNEAAFIASVEQHAEIVAAIEGGDAVRARQAMRLHLDHAEQALVDGMAAQR